MRYYIEVFDRVTRRFHYYGSVNDYVLHAQKAAHHFQDRDAAYLWFMLRYEVLGMNARLNDGTMRYEVEVRKTS